jgi:GTP-binding protein HflX
LDCAKFVDALEAKLARVTANHVVRDGQESAILISVSKHSRSDQEERLEELAELVRSDGITVLETVLQRSQEIHPASCSGKLRCGDQMASRR